MRRLFQWTVAVSLIIAVGGHWALLQSVAWVGMAVSYSQEAPLLEALQKTFDGEHPCKLCKAVDAAKKAEAKEALLKVDTKLEFLCIRSTLRVFPPLSSELLLTDAPRPPSRADAPPIPPPRHV